LGDWLDGWLNSCYKYCSPHSLKLLIVLEQSILLDGRVNGMIGGSETIKEMLAAFKKIYINICKYKYILSIGWWVPLNFWF
jgi:hypothetical protein